MKAAAGPWQKVKDHGQPEKGGRYLVIYKIRVSPEGEERKIEKHFDTVDFKPGEGWLTGFAAEDMKVIAYAEPNLPENYLSVNYEEKYAGDGNS